MSAFLQTFESSTTSVESFAGALIEIRFVGSPVLQEVVEFEARLFAAVRRVIKQENRRAILCTDLRACGILGPDVSERIITLMRHDSPHIERNGLLRKSSAMLGLQTQRIIEESGARDRRRMFTDESRLVTWLSEVANPGERARLRLFLGSAPVHH
jgi:hypothetical protein